MIVVTESRRLTLLGNVNLGFRLGGSISQIWLFHDGPCLAEILKAARNGLLLALCGNVNPGFPLGRGI